jgi:2',3'-cyclic-nucleotide 2'-phosphodiesterase (5'-nucleotidase family)
MKMKGFSRIALLIFLLTTSIISQAVAVSDTTTVVILSVNDMHAKIDNFPRFKAMVDSIRQAEKYVLLLSAGDIFTGNPVVDQFPEKGQPIIELMNRTGFSASAVGNHEFDYGQEMLARRMNEAHFPFLSANILPDSSSPVSFKPYVIITLENGIRIGILSLIQVNDAGLPDTHPSRLEGLTFPDGLKVAPSYASLRDSCDVFIALTHLGYETDIELAGILPSLDLILGGHSHTLVKTPAVFNDVLIMQAGSGLRYLTKTTLKLYDKKLVSRHAETLSIPAFTKTDEELEQLILQYNDNKELNEVIGTALSDIRGSDELGSMMTDAMAAIAPIEIAFQNNGGIRVDNFPEGDITIKNVYQLDPFGNEIILFYLTPAEIRSLILNAYNRERAIDLQTSGIIYTVLTDAAGNGLEVEFRLPDGAAPDEKKAYATGISSYIASSYQFDHKDEGTSLYTITAQSLINYIRNKKALDYKGVKRAFVKSAD